MPHQNTRIKLCSSTSYSSLLSSSSVSTMTKLGQTLKISKSTITLSPTQYRNLKSLSRLLINFPIFLEGETLSQSQFADSSLRINPSFSKRSIIFPPVKSFKNSLFTSTCASCIYILSFCSIIV